MILISALIALICAAVILAISNCLIDVIVWILAIFAVLMLCGLAVFFAILGFGDHSSKLENNNFSASTVKSYQALLAYKWYFVFALWVTLLIIIGFVTYLILNRRALQSSARIIEFSNRKMLSNLGVAILAIVFFVLQLATFVAGLYFLKNIYSNGTVAKDLATGSPYMQYSLGTLQWGLLIGMVVAWIWFFMFINNLGDYMISALICEDYFKTGGILGAVCNTLIWHCGSVALASAVMFPCAIWRFLYGWIHDLITAPLDPSNPGNKTKIQTIFKFACICCEWPYKKFAMRTGEHGFPMSYLASCNYCPATKEAYYLMRGYESAILDYTFIFRFEQKCGICLGQHEDHHSFVQIGRTGRNCGIKFRDCTASLHLFAILPEHTFISNPNYHAVAVLTVLIGGIFMNALDTVTEAALICYLIDLDTGTKPRDVRLNEYLEELANKEQRDARMKEFELAGGRHMGSKYNFLDDPY